MRTHFQTLLLAIIVILIAAALGLWRLEVESIWHDEAWSIRAIRSPFGTPDDNTPYLYYWTLHLLQKLGAGETPFALRYGSVLIHLVTVALGFRIAVKWYSDFAGFTAGILLGISPLLWEYAQEVRAYVAVPLIALALLAGAEALLQKRETIPIRLWIFLAGVELAGLYTHNLVVPLIVWLNIVIFAVWGWRWLRGNTKVLRWLIIWTGLQGMLFLLYIPWLKTQSPSGTTLNTPPEPGFKLMRDIWQGYFFPLPTSDLPEDLLQWVSVFGLVAVLLMLVAILYRRSFKNWLIFSQVVIVPIFSTLLLLRASIDFHPRYYVAGVPALLLLLAGSISGGKEGGLRFSRYGSPKGINSNENLRTRLYKNIAGDDVGVGSKGSRHNLVQQNNLNREPVTHPLFSILLNSLVIALAGIITYSSLSLIAKEPRYQHNDFRGLAEYYAQLPANTLMLIPFEDEPALQVYYADHLDIQAQFLTIPLHSSPEEAIQRINAVLREGQTTRIEFLTWFQLPADERGMYPCLLAGVGEEAETYFETYGLRSDTFYLDKPIHLKPIAIPAQFNAALQLTDTFYTASTETVCLQANFQLEQTAPTSEYKVAADILTPLGWELAGDDSPVRRDDQAMVEVWEPGDTGAAFLAIQLPPGTPAGNYDWLIRLYSENEPNGVDVINSERQPLGKDMRLPALMLTGNPVAVLPESSVVQRDNANNNTVYSGQELKVELLNAAAAEILILRGSDFLLEHDLASSIGLAWATFRIPPDAENGTADLIVDGEVVATYSIEKTERIFEQPAVEIEINQVFPGVGTLIGVNLPSREAQPGEDFTVELVWLAGDETITTNYRVFVQLLGENRAQWQSDSEPASGQRPTSTWVTGEYLVDSHLLHWNELEYTGKATLIVGLYNPITAERILLPDGTNYITIPVEIEVR